MPSERDTTTVRGMPARTILAPSRIHSTVRTDLEGA
jgi:hypothetical protein